MLARKIDAIQAAIACRSFTLRRQLRRTATIADRLKRMAEKKDARSVKRNARSDCEPVFCGTRFARWSAAAWPHLAVWRRGLEARFR